jgi:hypothetical protein
MSRDPLWLVWRIFIDYSNNKPGKESKEAKQTLPREDSGQRTAHISPTSEREQ